MHWRQDAGTGDLRVPDIASYHGDHNIWSSNLIPPALASHASPTPRRQHSIDHRFLRHTTGAGAARGRLAGRADGEVDDQVTDELVMREAWGRLGENERETLALTAWDGLDSAQAAVVLGCTSLAFRTRLSRARRHLTALLDAAYRAADEPIATTTASTTKERERPCAVTVYSMS